MPCITGNEFYNVQTYKFFGEISHNDVKYYVTSRLFQGEFYDLEVINIIVTKKFNPSLFSKTKKKKKHKKIQV